MKKARILPALLALVMLIAGCKAPPGPESANHVDMEHRGDVAVEGTVSGEEGRWAYRVTTYTVTGEHCACDDSRHVITRHSYQMPTMTVLRAEGEKERPSAATQAAEQFNAYFKQVLQDEVAWFDEMAAAADEDYNAVGHERDSLWQDREFCYNDKATLDFWSNDRLVCVTTTRNSFTGGAHPNVWRSAVTFDLRTGKTVTVADLADDIAVLRSAVEQELLRQAEERLRQPEEPTAEYVPLSYYDDYAETLSAWMERTVTFGEQGMTVIFGVYDIAPHSAGEQCFLIPYRLLKPYLNDFGADILKLTH